jgi:hypothetical protein
MDMKKVLDIRRQREGLLRLALFIPSLIFVAHNPASDLVLVAFSTHS